MSFENGCWEWEKMTGVERSPWSENGIDEGEKVDSRSPSVIWFQLLPASWKVKKLTASPSHIELNNKEQR